MRETTRDGVAYSFAANGRSQTVRQAFDRLAVGGTATVIGMVPSQGEVVLGGIDFLQEKNLQGSVMGSNRFHTDIPNMIEMYLHGRLLINEMVTHTRESEAVNECLNLMRSGEADRTVIAFSTSSLFRRDRPTRSRGAKVVLRVIWQR